MFGSVDQVDLYINAIKQNDCTFKLHIDGAYGGFFYPFTGVESKLDFSNPHVDSVTLDAHKMVQAPYGTGVFLARKGLIQHTNTKEASYVEGEDFTLIGSRSGANAIAVWMILMTYGWYGWCEKITVLLQRTNWLSDQLKELGISFFRNQSSNIITIKSEFLTPEIAKKYGLVPDNHHSPNWYKVIIMDHVTVERLIPLVKDLHELNA